MATPLHSWKQRGVVRLWRYTELTSKYGGWHMTADGEGVQSLVELFPLLGSAPGEYRTVTITAPSAAVLKVPNFQQGRAKWAAPTKWQLRYVPEPDLWQFPVGRDSAQFTFGASYLASLVSALRGIPRGQGDFCIGKPENGNLQLCFWWHPNAA